MTSPKSSQAAELSKKGNIGATLVKGETNPSIKMSLWPPTIVPPAKNYQQNKRESRIMQCKTGKSTNES